MDKWLITAGLALSAAFACASGFENGDFELDNLNGWTTSGDVSILTDGATRNHYARVQDNSVSGSALLSQSFDSGLPSGAACLVSVDMLGARVLPGGLFRITFLDANNTVLDGIEFQNNGSQSVVFGAHHYLFDLGTGAGPFVAEVFADPGTETYVDVDNFAVVPEPASLIGLLGGFSAFGLRRRRR